MAAAPYESLYRKLFASSIRVGRYDRQKEKWNSCFMQVLTRIDWFCAVGALVHQGSPARPIDPDYS